MRYVFLLLVVAGCASTDVSKMSDLDLCYAARVDEDNKDKAMGEINRRKLDCKKYSAEIQKMWETEQRAGSSGGEMTPAQGTKTGSDKKGY